MGYLRMPKLDSSPITEINFNVKSTGLKFEQPFERIEMPKLKINQYRSESNAWQRSLSYMTDENIQMKIRLAEILSDDFDLRLLPMVENFHSLVLNEEEVLNLLRHNVAELNKSLLKEGSDYHAMSMDISHLRTRLQFQIAAAEKRFTKLKSEFYEFLSENL